MKFAFATVLATALFAAPAFADDQHRELGAHVHGHGNLDIAVEGTKVSMSLEAPGMDIVGFEHAAKSSEQKAAVDKATATLSAPLTLFNIPAAAGCKVTDAKVALEAEHDHDHGDDDHDHDAKKGADADHDHDHDKDHAGHNQFEGTYALECAKPAEITSIAFDYFKSFAGAQGLTVNVVTAKAQNKYEVTRDKPTLDLGGMM
jgi:uncharacterized membrane protein YkoI